MLLGHDLGTALVLIAIVLALLWFVGAPLRLFALLGGGRWPRMVAGLVAQRPGPHASGSPAFRDPFASYQDSGWQGAQGLFALASGGWSGSGLGASREKWGYLPEAHTDFIFAIIGEELGLVGTLGGAGAVRGPRLRRVPDRRPQPRHRSSRSPRPAITAWIAVQALVNIGAVLGLLPITGIPLPLVSYGGCALLPTLVALGMLLSFARREPGAAAALRARRADPCGHVPRGSGSPPVRSRRRSGSAATPTASAS